MAAGDNEEKGREREEKTDEEKRLWRRRGDGVKRFVLPPGS